MEVVCIDGTVIEADKSTLDKEGVTLEQEGRQQKEYETIGFVQYEHLRYIVDASGAQIQTRQESGKSKQKSENKQPGKGERKQGSSDVKAKGDQLAIEEMQVNAPGVDDWHKNQEYLVFTNTGSNSLELSGWTVRNEEERTYQFPDGFTLRPNKTVTLHSGSGDDTDTDLYWDSDRAVWKNDSDTITVRNADGNTVLEKSYP